jgi:hypothetical protein
VMVIVPGAFNVI